jgi:hypothetical protein
VPEISRYYGITIRMRYNDHPPPHFHAHYSGQGITVEIETGRIEGVMSRNALQLIWSWLDLQLGMNCWRIGSWLAGRNHCALLNLWTDEDGVYATDGN